MSNINTPTATDFFGKDGMVTFIGVVEDVNDPKKSGRVKVRCVGWHPKEKEAGDEKGDDALSTDDLPWARVGMPVTHAQQSRIGGKHGLLPGCWVFGFFLDGTDAQDPFILSTFSFTSKASEQDYRDLPEGADGKFSSKDTAFDKNVVSTKTVPNIDVRMASEKEQRGTSNPNDPSGDNTLDDSDAFCPAEDDGTNQRSVASLRRMNAKLKTGETGNAESQRHQTINADGLCGSTAHARDDIQRRLAEQMPSQFSRFIYNDAVYNRFNGSYMNVNGILAQLGLEIGNLLKGPSLSQKAFTERTVNRVTRSTSLAIPDRDGVETQELDQTGTQQGDLFHALFGETVIDKMTSIIFAILKVIDQGPFDVPGEIGQVPQTTNTLITNYEAICITDQLLGNAQSVVDDAITAILEAIFGGGDGGGALDDLNNIVNQVFGLAGVMQFPLLQKYSQLTGMFNTAGSRSQDVVNKTQGCSVERVYDVELGKIKGLTGQVGTGGGSDGVLYNWTKLQFGGAPEEAINNVSTLTCEGALEILVPPPPVIIGSGGASGGGPVNPKEWGLDYDYSGVKIVPREYANPKFPINWERIVFKPDGYGVRIIPRGLPSSDPCQASNFANGLPNLIVVFETGRNYFFNNILDPDAAFPSIYIPGYNGTPIPVIDRATGEFVGVQVNCNSWDAERPNPSATAIPDSNPVGIVSDDPDYEVTLGAVFVQNTGFAYEDPQFQVIDRDTGKENGKVIPIIREGRIVAVDVVDVGRNFLRIPEIRMIDPNGDPGYGAELYPVMNIEARVARPDIPVVDLVYCPAKNQINILGLTS